MPTFTVFKGSKEGKIVQAETTRPDLEDNQVLVKVTASGLCGTDEHYKKAGCVLGHEGVGVVEATGPNAKTMKKGDRVGWGYEHDSCGSCEWCLTGKEVYCPERKMYGSADLDQGSFATHAVWKESFLFKIPDSLTDVAAAPLMCGGATVFTALHDFNIQPTDRVGVIGIGGLGHLAIQFAAKMGCDVVVFSGTESKKEEAMELGAKEFYPTKGKDKLDIGAPLNALLVTTSFNPDWSIYLPILAPLSKVFPMTVSQDDFKIPQMGLILNGITIQGTVVANRSTHRHMLNFAAKHQIKPITVEFPLTVEGIEEAMDTLDKGNMRYRGVLIPGK